ncbi:MAG: phosphotransferase [Shimia sp.]|nr:phosphotransferase [Shimia sp.]
MSGFFSRSLEEQEAIMMRAAQDALPLWGIDGATLSLIKHRENAVYRVETSGGAKFALRVHRPHYHSMAELRSEILWMSALTDAGVYTPAVVPAQDGESIKVLSPEGQDESFQIDILAWADGTPIGSLEDGSTPDADTLAGIYKKLGQLMARVHKQVIGWEKPEDFTRHAWDLDGLTGPDPFWGRYWELEILSDEQQELMVKVREKLRAILTEYGTDPDRFGLIHADFMPENILVNGDDVRVIDFDDAGYGWFMYDIATSVFFEADEPYFEQIVVALFEGYLSERELSEEHMAMLPVFMMARGAAVLG